MQHIDLSILSPQDFKQRRDILAQNMGKNSIAIIATQSACSLLDHSRRCVRIIL